MSALDSAMRLAASGGNPGISAAIAASGSFGSGLQKYSAQGASPAQAATMAFVDAGLEYATEKLSDSKMLEFFNNGTKKDFVKNFLWQTFGVEPLTEEVSLFAGVAAEAAILGDKNSQSLQIGEMVANGMSYEEAKAEVLKGLWKEAAETYAVSVFSAGLSSAGGAIAGNMAQGSRDLRQGGVAPEVSGAEKPQQAVDVTAASPQEMAPAPTVAAPMTDTQRNLQDAIETVTGSEAGKEQTQSVAGQSSEADSKKAEIQQLDARRAADQQRQKQVYEDLQSARRQQKELRKQIDKAEKKLRETGKGSQARIDQLKAELEQMNNLVNQIESQNTYFTGDYEKTVEEAISRQSAIFENAREAAQKAIADYEAGLITDAQLRSAQDAYNTAGQELYRLKHMTQEQYRTELAEAGLVANPVSPATVQQTDDQKNLQQAIAEISGNNQGKTVDSRSVQRYNNTRSEQVQKVIDRLNRGGAEAPTIDEIMAIPEIAEAERANEGPETINLPNREQIRENGYRQAMKKGSWNGKDYVGEVQQNRRMDIVIGLPGSGKSSVYTERLSQEHKSRVIDTDDFREYIPEYTGSNASIVHEESSEIRDRVFDTSLDNGDNILLSTIGANAEKLAAQIAAYKEEGYEVYLHLNELPNNKSLARAIGRYISEDGKLGRYVSPRLIAGYGDKPTQTYLYLTGQGGRNNGELDGNLRTGRGSASGDAAKTGRAPQGTTGTAAPADLLTVYDWYNNDVAKGEPPRLIQTSDTSNVNASAGRSQAEDGNSMPTDGGQPHAAAPAGLDYRNSNTYMNTGLQSESPNIRAGYRQELQQNPDAARYEVKHNADTLAEAESRTGSPEKNATALNDLLSRDHWTAEDVATSTLLMDQIMASGDKDTITQLTALRQKRKAEGARMGQEVQAFSIQNQTMKAAESPATAVDTFRERLDGMKPEETTWNAKPGMDFETWKEQIGQEVDRLGIAIAKVEEGDSNSMRQIIRQIAQHRNTTAWFGTSDNLTGRALGILKNLEFEDLKKIANTQLVAMADDYRARSKGEIVGGLRKQGMLSSLKTFVRNISGNTVGGFADAVSESGAGRLMDIVLSGVTGKRTIGDDFTRAGTYAKAAKEAGQFASLCVELNIPIETDVDGSYAAAAGEGGNSKYMGRTFRATGNPAMRALYAYQKYMSYALEVTDKIFEGGTNAAVAESLSRLKDANLTQEDVDALSAFTANKRTFKNATWKEGDKTKGAVMARKGSKLKEDLGVVGEVAMPYVNVPMNVAQTGIDYTAGVAKGLGEVIGIIKDARAGKTIPVERQRQAASDFGRGITGTAMIAMFASAAAMGALKVSNSKDWDKEALAQAEGRSGAQINWSALLRGLEGGDAKWQNGDIISGMDFLEPFNTQMYLGAELANADDINLLTYAGSTIKSVWQSLMDSPVMTGLADIEQTLKDVSEAEGVEDKLNVAAGYAGDVASSFVPQFVRQTAQNMDGYYRDTRGATPLESAINSLMAAIPGQSQKLPKKYSGLGEEQQRGSAVETFLDPTATRAYQENEVTSFLDELSGRTGDSEIYPSRQAPMRITVAGREVELDGDMRETYQKTYGQQVDALYRSLMDNPNFQSLSDELKTAALKEAEDYAVRFAKAAVSDYKEAPTGSPDALAKEIVNQKVLSQLGGLFKELNTAREYGYSTKETAAQMEDSYQAFLELDERARKEILDQATSDTAKYLEVRQKGVTTEQYLRVSQKVDGLTGDAQRWQAIAGMPGLSRNAVDTLMKAYMDDYDPNNKKSDTIELKYDYARQELDMSAHEFAKAYDIYSHEKSVGGEGTADRTRDRLEKELGITEADARQLYKLYGGQWKPWEE